jgi:hypothetical protein
MTTQDKRNASVDGAANVRCKQAPGFQLTLPGGRT